MLVGLLWAFAAARLEASGRSLNEPGFGVCVLPATVRIPDGATCDDMRAHGVPRAELDLMVGEAESVQLLLEARHGLAGAVAVEFPHVPLGPPHVSREVQPAVGFAWSELGYVALRRSPRYEASTRDGYWPDPLLDHATLAKTAVLWVTATTPRMTAEAVAAAELPDTMLASLEASITVSVGGAAVAVPLRVRVWPVRLPSTVDAQVTQYWNFLGVESHPGKDAARAGGTREHLYDSLEPGAFAQVNRQYFDLLAANRVPANDLEGDDEALWHATATHTPFVSLRMPVEPRCGAAAVAVAAALDEFAPTVERATEFVAGFNAGQETPRRLSVYLYDEAGADCEPTLAAVLAGLKARWPELVTIAPLNWRISHSVPLDVQAMQYDVYAEHRAHGLERAALGKQVWLYHCVEPSSARYMNTFIESPPMGSRLLFWLAALQPEITGWHYWSSASWISCPAGRQSRSREPKHLLHRRTEHGVPSAHTDFNPENYWVCDDPAYLNSTWTNGDGYVVYPGESGPVATARLHLIRDGIEDLELLRLLPDGADFAKRLVQGPTSWQGPGGPTAAELQQVRLEALARAAALGRAAGTPAVAKLAVAATGLTAGAAAAAAVAEPASIVSTIAGKVVGALAFGGAAMSALEARP